MKLKWKANHLRGVTLGRGREKKLCKSLSPSPFNPILKNGFATEVLFDNIVFYYLITCFSKSFPSPNR